MRDEVTSPDTPRVAFVCGKGGGDFIALQRARAAGLLPFRIVSFVTTSEQAAALAVLRSEPEPMVVPAVLDFRRDRETGFATLMEQWKATQPEWICLCGFPFLLPAGMVAAYPGKIVNSHPSLLPAHPGLFRKEELVASRVRFLGSTVHRVDAGMDTGEILAQAVFPNYGMVAFDRILRIYRFVQDLLMVQAMRNLWKNTSTDSVTRVSEIMFNPGVDSDLLELFKARYELH